MTLEEISKKIHDINPKARYFVLTKNHDDIHYNIEFGSEDFTWDEELAHFGEYDGVVSNGWFMQYSSYYYIGWMIIPNDVSLDFYKNEYGIVDCHKWHYSLDDGNRDSEEKELSIRLKNQEFENWKKTEEKLTKKFGKINIEIC